MVLVQYYAEYKIETRKNCMNAPIFQNVNHFILSVCLYIKGGKEKWNHIFD